MEFHSVVSISPANIVAHQVRSLCRLPTDRDSEDTIGRRIANWRSVVDFRHDLLKSDNSEMLSALRATGFSQDEAEQFLPEAGSRVVELRRKECGLVE